MREDGAEEKAQLSRRLCRFCNTPLEHSFVDLGTSPLANSYLKTEQLLQMEPYYPLHVYVCSACFLVQLEEITKPAEIFSDYSYFSSFSESWLEHAKSFAQRTIEDLRLNKSSRVVEIGSNDGYLLQFFLEAGIPVLGIEPAANVARFSQEKGIETEINFFNSALARSLSAAGKKADLIVANNVLAHIPDLNDLMIAFKELLKPGGVISLEFPHLLKLIEERQFDTIYHEHYSYFSLTAAERIFRKHELQIFDAELLDTHGGSLRITAGHLGDKNFKQNERVDRLLEQERGKGFKDIAFYESFGEQVQGFKREILKFLINLKDEGRLIAGYGAPAKGNTLLNYCGIGTDFIAFTVDRSPHKQGLYLPGSRIPIYGPEKIFKEKPDYLLILPWNLQGEVKSQMAAIREWGGKFLTLIPGIEVD